MIGKLITFEGIDGAGKSTQISMLRHRFAASGRFVFTRNPGGTVLGEYICNALRDRTRGIFPLAELFLFAADRAQHRDEIVVPALTSGKHVICDRYIDSSVAYQGHGRGIDIDVINYINKLATSGTAPGLTILLDIDVDTAISRIVSPDRIESSGRDFLQKVKDTYLDIAAKDSRFVVIDANQPPDLIHTQIYTFIDQAIGGVLIDNNLSQA